MKQANPLFGMGIYTPAVSATTGATTCTVSHSAITTDSIIEIFTSNSSGDVVSITNVAVTSGQAVLTFDALAENTSFRLRITNV